MMNGNEIVFRGEDGQALTNSLLVAEKFGKEHKHVLDAIRRLMGTAENSAVVEMFSESSYFNEQNKEQPMFLMNRDGFSLLVMGFNGKKAMQFKLEYIGAFNRMEKTIKDAQKPKSQLEILQISINQLVEQEHRLANVEHRLDIFEKEREENGKLLLQAELSSNDVPEVSMRNKIRKLVNQYAKATNTSQQDVWHKIYDNLYYAYNISVNSYKKEGKESKLDVAEKHGFLGKIFDIVSRMVRTNNK
jgi:Rha family phage regulatory protein